MTIETLLIIIIIVLAIGLGVVIWLQLRRPSISADLDTNQLIQTVLTVAQEKLSGDKKEIAADMKAKKESIETLVNDLRKDLDKRQEEIRQLEQDRNLKFGEITKSIEEHKRLTADLQISTSELNKILSNSQLRGSWGERAVQQLFTSVGLLENRHYYVQRAMVGSTERPDFTILLPGGRLLMVDAKFPLANLQAFAKAESKEDKARYDKAFADDVIKKIKEVSEKYISEAGGTCDYAIMFVPAEAVFDHINRAHPNVVDQAMDRKVIMASPNSLVAIIRTISESYRNFYYESSMREIVKKVDVFLNDWQRFELEFAKFGKNLTDAVTSYDQITTTRYKQMNLHIRQIQDARSGTAQIEGQAIEDNPLLETENE